jgi:hypothetical protein
MCEYRSVNAVLKLLCVSVAGRLQEVHIRLKSFCDVQDRLAPDYKGSHLIRLRYGSLSIYEQVMCRLEIMRTDSYLKQ